MTSKLPMPAMLAELFQARTGRSLESALQALPVVERDALLELLALSQKSIATRHKRISDPASKHYRTPEEKRKAALVAALRQEEGDTLRDIAKSTKAPAYQEVQRLLKGHPDMQRAARLIKKLNDSDIPEKFAGLPPPADSKD